MTDQSYVPKRPKKERDIDEALGFEKINFNLLEFCKIIISTIYK